MRSKNNKDEIYLKRKAEARTAISFLQALKENLEPEPASKIVTDAFSRYMTSQFEEIVDSTERGSQERFDKFRQFYEEHAQKTPYLEIMQSTPKILRVKFTRCPFFEILQDLELEEFAYPFCLSDYAFSKNVLPGVRFSRTQEIAQGGEFCDHTWEFY